MILNLTDVLTTEGKRISQEAEYTPDTLTYGGETYAVTEKTPVSLVLTNIGKGKANVEGTMRLTVLLGCDRCLQDVPYTFSLRFSNTVYVPEMKAAVSEEEADMSLFGYQIDVDDLVSNEISINWPMKVLCRSDCKGICSVCGRNLNEGVCECDTFVPDPRLAAIKDIFNAGKEV